jgi:hypothetical protein
MFGSSLVHTLLFPKYFPILAPTFKLNKMKSFSTLVWLLLAVCTQMYCIKITLHKNVKSYDKSKETRKTKKPL